MKTLQYKRSALKKRSQQFSTAEQSFEYRSFNRQAQSCTILYQALEAAFSWTDLQFFAVIDLHHLVGMYGTRCLNIHPSVPTMISSGGSDQLSWRTTSLAKSAGFMPRPLSVLTMISVARAGRVTCQHDEGSKTKASAKR